MGGVDKALIDVGGTTMLDRVLAALEPHCDQLVVVGPERETAVARVRFTIEDQPGGGPVPGVAAGLAVAPDADTVVVLAVDLPLLTSADVGTLLHALKAGIDVAAAPDHRGAPNPLLAAYRAPALRAAIADLGSDTPAARLLPTRAATVDLGPAATLNVNQSEDLDRAREALRQPGGRDFGV